MKTKPNGYWTKERCLKEGLKYKYKKDFVSKGKGAYMAARRNGWLDEIWLHMTVCGNLYKRCVYVYEFSDKSAYIGITYNVDKRRAGHRSTGPVHRHHHKTGLQPTFIQLTEYIDRKKAAEIEGEMVLKYRNNGYNILNSKKTGEFGGSQIIWTKEECLKVALKCKTKNEFVKNFRGAHNASNINGWLSEMQSHMREVMKPKGFWTKGKCKKEALKYKTREEFRQHNCSAYSIAYQNGWLPGICSHMKYITRPVGFWTKEKCKKEALKYKSRTDFKKYNGGAYSASVSNKWLNEFFNFKFLVKNPNYLRGLTKKQKIKINV